MTYTLVISPLFPPEPVVSARLSADISIDLRDKGYNIIVLKQKPSRPFGFNFEKSTNKSFGIKEVVLNSHICPQSNLLGRIWESISFGNHSAKYVIKHHDEINCIYANTWPMFAQKKIVKIAKKYSIPCIVHIQDIYPESYTNKIAPFFRDITYKILLPIDKFVLKNASYIIAISNNMKDHLSSTRNIDRAKIAVISNWQDEYEFLKHRESYKNKHKENEKFIYMYLGNIGPVAGVDFLIDSFAEANIENTCLVIAGSGSMKEIAMKQASKYKDADIQFWDVSNGKVPEIQDKGDVMLLPIKKGAAISSIPSKLPAYMFSAKPIIGCLDEDSDTAKAIIDAGCGWALEPENKEELIETMRKVKNLSPDELKIDGEKGFQYAMRHFSKIQNIKVIVKIIEQFC